MLFQKSYKKTIFKIVKQGLKKQDEVFQKFKEFICKVENLTEKKIKKLDPTMVGNTLLKN